MIKVLFLILLSSNLAELKAVERVFLDPGIDPLSDEMVNAINSLNTTWKAKRNFVGVSLDYVRGLLGVAPGNDVPIPALDIQTAEYIPESFDAREKWANCSSISNIPDQGSYGSCWAVAAVGAMSDRICIKSEGRLQVQLSAEDLLACCRACRKDCRGGYHYPAWLHWESDGIVTGGAFLGSGCQPYKSAPCKHNANEEYYISNCTVCVRLPECEKKCQPGYPKSYEEDRYYGKKIGRIGKNDIIKDIQTEIMTNGPVEATFQPYSDFFSYSSGVYQPHSRVPENEHAVRIIGWGVEKEPEKEPKKETEYWLVANSWNTYWGDQGYFKIKRGLKECRIEDKLYAGIPDFSKK